MSHLVMTALQHMQFRFVADLVDYIHKWHKYNPWGDDVPYTISRSIGQKAMLLNATRVFCVLVIGLECILIDHRSKISIFLDITSQTRGIFIEYYQVHVEIIMDDELDTE